VSPTPRSASAARADDRVDALFAALADGTRRTVLRTVVDEGPITATEVAATLPVSRQAVAKHLQILGEAGLVHSHRAGRETRFEASPSSLQPASAWIEATDAAWSRRLGDLKRQVEQRRR
jgi:DNA-binding transcriptional ArsR family regulator